MNYKYIQIHPYKTQMFAKCKKKKKNAEGFYSSQGTEHMPIQW